MFTWTVDTQGALVPVYLLKLRPGQSCVVFCTFRKRVKCLCRLARSQLVRFSLYKIQRLESERCRQSKGRLFIPGAFKDKNTSQPCQRFHLFTLNCVESGSKLAFHPNKEAGVHWHFFSKRSHLAGPSEDWNVANQDPTQFPLCLQRWNANVLSHRGTGLVLPEILPGQQQHIEKVKKCSWSIAAFGLTSLSRWWLEVTD